MIANETMPMIGVSAISNAGRMEMKVIDMPARVPSRAARGVRRRMVGAIKAHTNSMMPSTKTQIMPACHAVCQAPVLALIGSMMAKTTKNMCGTLGPEGSAVTSLRPSFSPRRLAMNA